MTNIEVDSGLLQSRGWILVENLLTPSEVDALRQSVERRSIRRLHGGKGGHYFDLTSRDNHLAAFSRNGKLLSRVREVTGPNIELHHSKLALKPATGGGEVAWHQDLAFAPHTNTDLVSAFIYLDDTDEENGAMRMVPESHKAGLLPHYDDDGRFVGQCQISDALSGSAQTLIAKAGSVSFHHGLTVHGSFAQATARERRGLVFWYRAADAVQVGGPRYAETGSLISGVNTGHQVRCTAQNFTNPS